MEAAAALGAARACRCTTCARWSAAEVAADTAGGPVEGTLLSCTSRSAWIVVGDVDHVVALPHLRAIHRR